MIEASTAGPPPVITLVETPPIEDEQAADAPVGDSVVEANPTGPPLARDAPPPPPGTGGRYTVQLGAFLDESRAEALLTRAEDAGLDVRLVRVQGSRLLHVGVGRFDSSAQARVFFRSVTGRGFTAAVVRDAQQEERVRG